MAALLLAGRSAAADPQLTSWFTADSGRYARIYMTTAAQEAGQSETTWSNSSFSQSLPAYSGVQEVDYSSNWVYLRSTGLGFHVMGPWYLDTAKMMLFPNLPVNTKTFTRIPRSPSVPASKTATGLGAIGCFVDGVAMYNSWDAYFWNGTVDTNTGSSTGYYWRRDAYVNEGPSFDPSNAHQDQSGTYHYHVNPPGIRYLLGDCVSYNPATDTYSENPANLHHSPILAWTYDGYPLYGPYGYSNPTNPASGVRRMISGYALRNGQNGTDDLVHRTTIPAWAVRLFNVSSNQPGPDVSTSYPLGRYMEDNDYLGDVGKVQGVDFDLDEYNGRYCVTPDFPHGTYAYFVSISSNGTPVYPYNIGAGFYGSPTGGSVTNLTESVVTNYLGGPSASLLLSPPVKTNNTVTLTWSATEGGTYKIEASSDLTTWTNVATGLLAQSNTAQTGFSANGQKQFYLAIRTNLAGYDPVTGSGSTGGNGGIASVSPTTYGRGTNFVLTINLNANANPSPPPANAPIISVTIGSNTGTSLTHVSQTEVQATFDLSGATGAQTVTVIFPGPPDDPANYVTYTLANGFTVK